VSGSDDISLLPPKRDVALALVQTATSVFIHLDPRSEAVLVPSWFKNQPELVLQVGLGLVPPIVDLDIGAEALSATLSFNRRPEFCKIPWSAIWGLVGDDGRGMIWPESVPPEVAARAPGRGTGAAKAGGAEKARKGGHLRTAGSPAAAQARTVSKQNEPATSSELTKNESTESPPKAEPPADAATSRKRELPPYLRIVK
jgi:hypothetical protein